MTMLDRDGTALYHEDTGSLDPTLLFVHGWSCDHTYFAPQVEHFDHRHRVVAVDLRGHGRSDAPEQAYTAEVFADDLAWLCEQLAITQPVVVGHSMGCVVALELADRHRRLPSALVLVDPPPVMTKPPELRALLAGLVEGLGGDDHRTVRQAMIDGMFLPTSDPALKGRVTSEMLQTPQHVAASAIDAALSWEGEAVLEALTVPTLFIGADRPSNDATVLRALNASITTGQTVGAGHFNQLEAPEQVNAMIERFLASLAR
jgi:pimeloyl-ACP methyl ester carboxylesterase